MIAALTLLVLTVQQPEVSQAAFTARVYLPGKARSYHDVNLWCRPERVDQLTNTKEECSNACWQSIMRSLGAAM